jgi:hypothetical protein
MRNRSPLVLCAVPALLGACKGTPRKQVTGPALWQTELKELSVSRSTSTTSRRAPPKRSPTCPEEAKRSSADSRPTARLGVRVLNEYVDDHGRTRMTHDTRGASVDVIDCANQAIANTNLGTTAGEYKITFKVAFSNPKEQTAVSPLR